MKKTKIFSLFTKANFLKFLFVLALLLRFLTFEYSLPEAEQVRVKGRVAREVLRFEKSQRINLQGHNIYLDKYPEIFYGDYVVVEGRVEGGKLKDAELVERQNAQGLYLLRRKALSIIFENLPPADSALVAGVLLGSKKNITSKLRQNLIDSGTIHVVVASGTNVTLTAHLLISVLIKIISRKKAIIFSLAGIWVYVVFAGLEAPLIRAAIMGSIAFGAQALGRVSLAINAFFVSVFLMLFLNPLWVYDVGFQLSFAATLSLIVFERTIREFVRRFSFVPGFIRQDFSTTLSAQTGVTPLLLFHFGRLNFASLLVNALILWTVPLIMLFGFCVMIATLIFPFMGKLYLLFLPLTQYFLFWVNIFS